MRILMLVRFRYSKSARGDFLLEKIFFKSRVVKEKYLHRFPRDGDAIRIEDKLGRFNLIL